MSATVAYTATLAEAGSVASAGGKGANLGELVRAGFPVPDGFVVTTAAYDRFVTDNDLSERAEALAAAGDTDAIGALFAAAALAPELSAAITGAYVALGEGAVAVRSSATAEDLPGASFAGQQETYLNISGPDAVLAAVRRCWASLWTPRAVAYRAHRTEKPGRLSIAVVVQRLVRADVSGVLFTANPATGRRDETVVTAAWGLGESVVGGRVDVDEYVVRTMPEGPRLTSSRVGDKQVMTVPTDAGSSEVATPDARRRERTLTDAQALELAALGERVAAHFGAPQDIEWVLHEGGFQLVQARPITALPEPTGEVPAQWPLPRRGSLYFRASIVEQMPDPLSPLFADMVRLAVPRGLHGLLGELSPRGEALDVDFPTINGYAFYDYSRRSFGSMLALTPGLLRVIGTKGFVLERWRDRELPRYRDAVAAWAERDPADLAATDLVRGAQELLDAGCLYYTTVQTIIPVASMAEITWTSLYERTLRRPGDAAASDYLLGFDSTPIAAEKSVATLATWCRTAGLAPALLAPDTDPLAPDPPTGVDAAVWRQWHDRLDAHLAAYGHTTYNLDIMNPVPADEPTPVLASLRYQLGGAAPDPRERQQRLADDRERLTGELLRRLDPVRTALARRVLAAAQHWAPIREDALAAMGLAWPVIRRLVREDGRRLAEAGALTEPDDVFWLTLAELVDLGPRADAGETLPSHAEQIAARRATWRGQALATPPQYLPESRAMQAWKGFLPAREQDEGPVLTGTTGSGGRVTGHARVLKGPADFASFVPGEILVAAITTPAYTPLFAQAAGVVTDVGGVLSHGSIVAREFGIPAVLGIGSATKRITTGDRITVDGTAGTVLLADAPVEAPAAVSQKRRSVTPGITVSAAVALIAALAVRAGRRRHRARGARPGGPARHP